MEVNSKPRPEVESAKPASKRAKQSAAKQEVKNGPPAEEEKKKEEAKSVPPKRDIMPYP